MPTQPAQKRSSFGIQVNYHLCHNCGACVAVCPADAIFLHNSALIINLHVCTVCELCLHACPLQALSMADAGQRGAG